MCTLYISIRTYPHDALLLSPEIFAFRLDMGPLAMWWAANKPPTLPEGGCPPEEATTWPPMSSPAKISCLSTKPPDLYTSDGQAAIRCWAS
jgi:hypothetical protein